MQLIVEYIQIRVIHINIPKTFSEVLGHNANEF